MKRVSFLLVTLALCSASAPAVRAQDAATEERLNKLSARIDDLEASRDALKKRVEDLAKDVDSVREQAAKPTANYARPEDLNRLADAIKDVDRKRMEDADKIHAELLKLRDVLKAPLTSPKAKTTPPPKEKSAPEQPAADAKVFPYTIRPDDTLDAIVQAYKEKNIKVTVAEILKANPGLKPERLIPGKKIYIPAPQP
ncbi:MAG: LysM peptidoglycan-binding domain-containing protein [Limisphaerales bacterium]